MDYRDLTERNQTDVEVRRFWDRLKDRPMTRRTFVKGVAYTSVISAAAACAPPGSGTSGGGGKKMLRILQWNHFIPAYDEWIDKFVAEWGSKNGVEATIDHINTDDLPARMAAEIAAKAGHDLVEMNGIIATYLYDKNLLDMGDIVDYAVKKFGKVEPIGERLAKVNGRWVGWPNYYISISPQVRRDLFQAVGFDTKNVKTWDDYLKVGQLLKARNNAAGFAISHCNDANHNWRAIMWAFGTSEIAADGKTPTVDTKEMKDFLKWVQEFHAKANNADVFAWDNASDNRWLASGQGGYIHDAISSMRSIQDTNKPLYDNVELRPPVAGPAKPQGISNPDSNVYIIWSWAPQRNQEMAKDYLRHFIDNYEESFKQSKLYNQPMHTDRYKADLFPVENGKYASLQNYRGDLVATFGYPGPPTYEATQVLATFVIPDMVQKAVSKSGDPGITDAVKFGVDRMKSIYLK